MNITLTGDFGSGKSTIGNILKNKGYTYVSVSKIFREEAEKLGLSVIEYNKLAETDESIDKHIDDLQRSIGETGDNLVFDSRLAFHFVPHSFKVYTMVNMDEAARRIYAGDNRVAEKHSSLSETKEAIRERRSLEVARYKDKYGVDYTDYDNYNLVLDTTYISPEEAAETILSVADELAVSELGYTYARLCAYNVHPVKLVKDFDNDALDYYSTRISAGNRPSRHDMHVEQDKNGVLWVAPEDTELFAAYLLNKKPIVPANVKRGNGFECANPVECCYELEELCGFKYKHYPK